MKKALYRDNVCAVIRSADGSVLVGHRSGFPSDKGWQFPQGGIDPGLDLIKELKRELFEEIGNDRIRVIAVSPKTYIYDYPESILPKKKGYAGQRQRWVLCEFLDKHPLIKLDREAEPEFDGYRWVRAEDALELCVWFKKEVYGKAMGDLGVLEKDKKEV
jgi:putative (di)nucleoside polyphosphate hydrolase